MPRPASAPPVTAAPSQIYGEDVVVGDEITPLEVTPDVTGMFFFSAATYNGHRIHYDTGWACDKEGYPAVLVQGPMQSALLARAVTDWMGPRGVLRSFSAQNRASAFPGQRLGFQGTVTAVDRGETTATVRLELRGTHDGEVLMPGTATVELPLRGMKPTAVGRPQ